MNQTNSRIKSKIYDHKLGLWTSIAFLGREQNKLSTVNAYRIIKSNIEISGIVTNYHQ